jgi:hypothetical protein
VGGGGGFYECDWVHGVRIALHVINLNHEFGPPIR